MPPIPLPTTSTSQFHTAIKSWLNYNFSAWRERNTHCFNTSSQHHISVGLAWKKIKKQLLILQYIKFLISHKPCRFLEICWIATQSVNLYSLELEILLLLSCVPSSVRCFPGPTSLLSSQENLKGCTHAEPWELFQPHRGCTGWCSKWMTQLCASLTPQICSEAQKGLSWPLTFDWLLLSWQRLTSIQKLRKISNYMVPRDETAPETPQSFPGLPLKSWLLWSSLLQIHRKPDRFSCISLLRNS